MSVSLTLNAVGILCYDILNCKMMKMYLHQRIPVTYLQYSALEEVFTIASLLDVTVANRNT